MGEAYGNIGNTYIALGDYEQALALAKRIGYREVKEFAERKLNEKS